jgi:hypothetical protein
LIACLGSGILALLEQPRRQWAGVGLLVAALAVMMASYLKGYYRDQLQEDRSLEPIAAALKKATRPDEVVVLYGLDYSAQVPYLADRRAIMDWQNLGVDHPALRQTLAALEQPGIGALAACDEARHLDLVARAVERLGLRPTPTVVEPCDLYTR